MKVLILDSGPLINLSMNGLLYLIEDLKKNFNGKFIITEQVKNEVYDRPKGIKRFKLGALRIKSLLDKKIIEPPSSLNITNKSIEEKTTEMMDLVNHSYKSRGQWINLVSKAEMSCLALNQELIKQKIDSIIAIDERTTRVICEKPENLEKLMTRRLHKQVRLKNPEIKKLKDHKIIRSSELVYVAYKKGIVKLKDPKVLEALIYATKFKGSSISFEEIDVLKKL
ncbi:hypothetical protein CXX78_00210 [Candidatus Parvarchaeota archaeon]|nr:MAG: hypothetical protein CXX78_01225 [Candidatus Parvarchaeota archaeon]PXY71596.1 MAG: hypothetical protein CXX78_00210 [Candidatus Parvarchaeota archaeon]